MRNKNSRTFIAAFLGSALVAGIVAASGTAKAWWTRSSAATCAETITNDTSTFIHGCNDSTTGAKTYQCNVPDSSLTPKASITSFDVRIEKYTSGAAMAARCVRYRDAAGGTCGTYDSSTATGSFTLQPAAFSGWTTTNYGYLSVILPASQSSTNQSCLKGFLTAG